MARVRRTVVVCDMDSVDVEAAGRVEIILDGNSHTLDLCADHLRQARIDLRPWLRAGHEVRSRSHASGRSTSSAAARRRSADIRAWASENRIELPARGRISAAVHAAYDARER